MCSCHVERPPIRNSSTNLGSTIFNGKRKSTLQAEFPEPEQKKVVNKISFIKILESAVKSGQGIGVIIFSNIMSEHVNEPDPDFITIKTSMYQKHEVTRAIIENLERGVT